MNRYAYSKQDGTIKQSILGVICYIIGEVISDLSLAASVPNRQIERGCRSFAIPFWNQKPLHVRCIMELPGRKLQDNGGANAPDYIEHRRTGKDTVEHAIVSADLDQGTTSYHS